METHNWEPFTEETAICSKCGEVIDEVGASEADWVDTSCTPDPLLIGGA